MSEFRTIEGFEDIWRAAALKRPRSAKSLRPTTGGQTAFSARLERLARRAPETVIRITGRANSEHALRKNLQYISRDGELPLTDRDGVELQGRHDFHERASDWAMIERCDRHSRPDRPLGYMVVLSAPEQADSRKVEDAARAFAEATWGQDRDYLSVLHTDTSNPHVHFLVRGRGDDGHGAVNERFAVLQWRETYAEQLRRRGIEAEATSRLVRGMVDRSEKSSVYRMRRRAEQKAGPWPEVTTAAYRNALKSVGLEETTEFAWEKRLKARQVELRTLYAKQAQLLLNSENAEDQALGVRLAYFTGTMPRPQSQREQLLEKARAAVARQKDSSKSYQRER